MEQPISFKLLECVFKSEHLPNVISGHNTHNAALRFVAQLVSLTQDSAYIKAIVGGALPTNYQSNTLSEIPRMVADAIAKGFDKQDKKKSRGKKSVSLATELIGDVLSAGVDLFHSPAGDGYISWPLKSGGRANHRIGSSANEARIVHLFYNKARRSVPAASLREAVGLLKARAILESPEEVIYIRVGSASNEVIIDLGTADGKVVKIDRGGWKLSFNSPARMWRSPGYQALPEPRRGGNIKVIQEILRLDDNSWFLVLGFIINCLNPNGPYMCFLVEGEQGSGKSLLCWIIKRIIDPHQLAKSSLPADEGVVMIHAKDQHLLVYDNTSSIRPEVSDALCTLATGGGIGKRRLYTDDELHVLFACRPFIINGISDFATRPDLLERGIVIKLKAMSGEQRRAEKAIIADLDGHLPDILGCLFDVVSSALSRRDTIAGPEGFRMTDAALWIAAAEPALGVEPGSILDAIRSAQIGVMEERVENDPLVIALRSVLEDGPFEGPLAELLKKLRPDDSRSAPRSFPDSPAHLSKYLKRMKPAMEKSGIKITFLERTRETRGVRIELTLSPEERTSNRKRPDY